MKSIQSLLLFVLFGGLIDVSCAAAPQQANGPGDLSCTVGPLEKTYGKTQWTVYGCNDGRSVVVTSAPGNPAMPFYFFFVWGSEGMELHGEGTGEKNFTDAAFEELKALTEADVAGLFQEAKAAGDE
jgi:hypothetical protein